MIKKTIYLVLTVLILFGCNSSKNTERKEIYKSEHLVIIQLSPNAYEHVSFLDTQDFGKVECNGLVVTDKNEAVVFDTPTDDTSSEELINWVNNTLNCKITAVIPTHYHADNLGGLTEFHRHNIPSYAYEPTLALAESHGFDKPIHSFNTKIELRVGNKKVIAEFPGGGHTEDNVIGYFPSENILFGGCLIKALGSGKGNLEEANVNDWAESVQNVKISYPEAKIVIPGHGPTGGRELLDYTIDMFE